MRRLILLVLALGALAIPTTAAAAEVHVPFCGVDPQNLQGGIPNCTFTANSNAVAVLDKPNLNPCRGLVATPPMVSNSTIHVSANAARDVWLTTPITALF